MEDFCKIFNHDKVGQVLLLKKYDIPDEDGDCMLEITFQLGEFGMYRGGPCMEFTKGQEASEKALDELFDSFDEEKVNIYIDKLIAKLPKEFLEEK